MEKIVIDMKLPSLNDYNMELVIASALIFMMFCIGYILVDYWKHWRK
jgi:hypothetical protein